MSLTAKLNVSFAGALALLAIIGLVSYRSTTISFEQAREACDSLRVLNQLEMVFATVSEAESAARAFRLTGDKTFLGSYQAAAGAIAQRMADLRALSSSDTAQREHLYELDSAVRLKLAHLERSIGRRRERGFDVVTERQVTSEGAAAQRLIRTIVDNMRADEQQLRDQRATAAQRAANIALAVIPAGSAIAILLITLALLRLHRELAERRRAEEELRSSELRLQRIFDSAMDAVISIDSDSRIVLFNPAAERMFGVSRAEALGQPLDRFIPETARHEHRQSVRRFAASWQTARAMGGPLPALAGRRADGAEFPIEVTISRAEVQGRWISTAVVRDITGRRLMEKMKDEFISMVSHELRTPLASIRGALGLIAGGVLDKQPDKARHMMSIAVSNTERLARLIDDILDIERLESGRVPLNLENRSAADLMERAAATIRPTAEGAGVSLRIHGTTARVRADGDRVLQTLTNLISNAIKFSPRDTTVTLAAERRDNEVMFTVRDDGRGIPTDKLEAVFERFSQIDASDSREKGGTGLGLPICRMIVQQHGGCIWAESKPGQGATFFFTLPAQKEPSGAPAGNDVPADLPGGKVHNAG